MWRCSVKGEVETDEEALGPVLAHHDGLEGVDVGPAGLVLLLDLDGVPVALDVEQLQADMVLRPIVRLYCYFVPPKTAKMLYL